MTARDDPGGRRRARAAEGSTAAPTTRADQRTTESEEATRLERGYRLVMNSVYLVGALFGVAIIGIGVMAIIGGDTATIAAMLTAVTGVIGSLVGAYFGIQVGNEGRQQVEDRAEQVEGRAEGRRQDAEEVARRALAVLSREDAAAVLGMDLPARGRNPASASSSEEEGPGGITSP